MEEGKGRECMLYVPSPTPTMNQHPTMNLANRQRYVPSSIPIANRSNNSLCHYLDCDSKLRTRFVLPTKALSSLCNPQFVQFVRLLVLFVRLCVSFIKLLFIVYYLIAVLISRETFLYTKVIDKLSTRV